MQKKSTSHFVAGIVTAIVSIMLFFVYYYTGKSFESNFISIVPYIVSTVLLIMFVILYARANKNQLIYGELFSYGFRATMIFSLLMVGFIIGVIYLMPDYKEKYIAVMRHHLAMDQNMTAAQKEITLSTTLNNFQTIQVGFNLFMNLIAGTLGTLIGAGLAAKKRTVSAVKD